ncbi:DMT family transporter [Marivibrio halodurans]|uniref:DMT family transporter n=1 Tax=Marivibrio halodurans TaxID=2039722 RepID=A0A8J7V2R7_9PROT|nr:DMT family transporter [Marivibrio halodurans]MBP5857441.1 DMT family transporter [Marivibrio halodurans]
MSTPIGMLIAAFCGMCLALQAPVNASMSKTLGSPVLAATISIGISFLLMAAVWLTWDRGGSVAQIKALPWWAFLGAVFGAIFVVGSIMVAPVTGIALLFVCVIAGQLIGASVADHFGAFGLPVEQISLTKALGLLMVLGGAYLVQRV